MTRSQRRFLSPICTTRACSLLLFLLACFLLIQGFITGFIPGFLSPSPCLAKPQSMADLQDIANNLVVTKIKHGAIPAIYNPTYMKVQEADLSMERDVVVFVVMLPDGVHIYPQKILVWHQIVNELIDDYAFVITYCPITGTLAAFNASLRGMNLLFDTEGRLYDGNSVLIDRNTGSLWLQELGMAIEGPLVGRGLNMLEVYWTTWGPASRVFPNAKVLNAPNGHKAYGRDPYGSYMRSGTYYDNDTTIYRLQRIDRRLHKKSPMLCFELQGQLLAIDINYVKKKGSVNFFLGPMALVAVHDPKLDVIRVFDRRVWAEPFLYVRRNGKIRDLQTMSIWDPSKGLALEGTMKGASLKEYHGHYSMWMAWYSIHPETYVIPGPGEVQENMLSADPVGQTQISPRDPLRNPAQGQNSSDQRSDRSFESPYTPLYGDPRQTPNDLSLPSSPTTRAGVQANTRF